MALEPLTPEQRAAALDKAFKARQARAEVKTELKAGRTTLSAVLDRAGSDEALSKMKVHDLLRSLPGVGDRRASALMEEIGIAASRRLKGLGVHQRAALLAKFGAS
ncbi:MULTISPECIES: integration host factor, actinobacterial type [Brevibacterium]|uniref:Integration host factor, actinobacterial type n=1 Tax=Brevibacterium pityocampae TaxID=506594 RepID=A0ABP8JNU2_9MICO|nr:MULTISPECIES: integration host factor, actinobacterial type [Actinomycetes]MCK1802545.1 DNA-binding protein [Brevibacterium sp. R8603A2]MCX0278058.1 integration host factor [Nocardia zapadnayensis]QCP05882.1 DNA-binding protein [Brevibacterium sp. CS2]